MRDVREKALYNRAMLKEFDLSVLTEPLLEWYEKNKRVLPWRELATPYRVWVSEIMLQQTRVEAVKPFFERFTNRLPDVQALADCPEDELLKLWEGLGYYNRVRNMQKAAIQVMEQHGGELPADYNALLQLKGIGSYTAGAIASIAYQIPVPAVDGNVLRILTRVAEDDTDIMKASFRKQVEEQLMAYMQSDAFTSEASGTFNQALMELGAMVCVPNGAPKCEECPWKQICLAKRKDRISELPVKAKAKERRIEKRTVLVIRDGEQVAIRKRPSKGLLAGLYELPNTEGYLTQEEALAYVKERTLSPIRIQKLPEAKHIFSHVEWQMQGYAILIEEPEQLRENFHAPKAEADVKVTQSESEMIFVEAETSEQKYAIPAAFAAYAKYMGIKIGQERFLEE